MKKVILICVLLLATFMINSPAGQTQKSQTGHAQWVAKSLSAIQTIKVGMTRRDVLKLFTVEGGVSNRMGRTYVFRECPNIKVDVQFDPVGALNDKLTEQPQDKITAISKPYLEQTVID